MQSAAQLWQGSKELQLARTMTSRSNKPPQPLPEIWTPGISLEKVTVLGSQMAYRDSGGSKPPVVFLHGNPTSSYLWRNVIPHVRDVGRCLAPDLIGMGHSDKLGPDFQYRFVEHARYLDGWFDALGLTKRKDVTLVIHDWGSALGLWWARRHSRNIRAIVHMESLVHPKISWESFPGVARNVFQLLRSEAGEKMIAEKNYFVEKLLPMAVMRTMSEGEMEQYRAPFRELQWRKPTLTWPREIPILGEGPADVQEIVTDYTGWIARSPVPKLFIGADPGFFTAGCLAACKHWPNQQFVTVKGLHFLQEDSPGEIGQAITAFLKGLHAAKL